ncbi:Paf1 complex component [Coemansia aciculifera]|uniref:Paf1 complex component n=1 Tax=Coemansia aciculifera TaxID=417176 RepID=A0A9W8IHE3_9FUNG|nr:Paf1 complex component [Coemansia aciculifera]
MSDLFGSDLSDVESQGSRLSSPRGSPRRRSHSRDSATPEPKKSRYDIDSDEGGAPVRLDIEPANGDALDDLFGSDDDAEMRGSDNESTRSADRMLSDDEAPEGLSKVNVRVMSAKVPLFPVPRSDRDAFILTRMPNILQLDPTPFSADSYEDLIKKEHEVAAKHSVKEAVPPELASAVEGIIGNTIRWRRTAGADGKTRRESNARLVRWSDGSTSIVIGGQAPEAYSITSEPLDDSAKTKQHHYAAVLYQNELLMQSHARLTEQWLLRPTKQSAQSRAAVSLLLGRIRGEAALGAGNTARAAAAKTSRTRFEVDDENPELIRKRAVEEDERREKQRKKEERLRERMEAKGLQSDRRNTGYNSSTYAGGGDYSEEENEYGYDSESNARAGGPGAGYGAQRSVKRDLPQQSRRPRNIYADEELEDFIDDDEPEVGPRDEFDDEEEEERAAQRLKSSKRTEYMDGDGDESDGGRDNRRARNTKPRRLMVSDDEDDNIDI